MATPIYNAMLKAEAASGSMDGALNVLVAMHESGCKANAKTWSELQQGALKNGRQDIFATVMSGTKLTT